MGANTFYVHSWAKSLNGNNGILLVVDGLERDNAYQVLRYLTPEEVESVTVLRDAAAVALYGYKGANGVVNIVTKRGLYKKREISFAYDHGLLIKIVYPKCRIRILMLEP